MAAPLPVPEPRHRPPLALACGIAALVLVAVLPPVAWIPGVAAILLGADVRERAAREGRRDLLGLASMALGAVAIAVGIALVVAAFGGS